MAALERLTWKDRLEACGKEEWQRAREVARAQAERTGRRLVGAPRICGHCGRHGHTTEFCPDRQREELVARVTQRRVRLRQEARRTRKEEALERRRSQAEIESEQAQGTEWEEEEGLEPRGGSGGGGGKSANNAGAHTSDTQEQGGSRGMGREEEGGDSEEEDGA